MSQVQTVATRSIPPDRYAFPSGEGALGTASVLSVGWENLEKNTWGPFSSHRLGVGGGGREAGAHPGQALEMLAAISPRNQVGSRQLQAC